MVEGLHLRDYEFGAVLLLVCANGSRYSDDPRIYVEGSDSELSLGWRWFRQVQFLRRASLLRMPTLHDLQFYCVSPVNTIWLSLGILHGLRALAFVPVYHRHVNTRTDTYFSCRGPSPWSKARTSPSQARRTPINVRRRTKEASVLVSIYSVPFCRVAYSTSSRVLVSMDRMLSAYLGRPTAVQEEEYAFITFYFPIKSAENI